MRSVMHVHYLNIFVFKSQLVVRRLNLEGILGQSRSTENQAQANNTKYFSVRRSHGRNHLGGFLEALLKLIRARISVNDRNRQDQTGKKENLLQLSIRRAQEGTQRRDPGGGSTQGSTSLADRPGDR